MQRLSVREAHQDHPVTEVVAIDGRQGHAPLGVEGVVELS